MQPAYMDTHSPDPPTWRTGSHKLRGSRLIGTTSADWDILLHLSNWDAKHFTFDAVLQCPSENPACFITHEVDGEVRKFHCDREGKICHLDLKTFEMPSASDTTLLKVHQIYGEVGNPMMDVETGEGKFYTSMHNRGNPRT